MKVQASVKRMCRNCKVVKRKAKHNTSGNDKADDAWCGSP
jgi:hypothetical protein